LIDDQICVQIRPFVVKNHMMLFVNCSIKKPTFYTKSKEHMTLKKEFRPVFSVIRPGRGRERRDSFTGPLNLRGPGSQAIKNSYYYLSAQKRVPIWKLVKL
jgi:hypothetical protein